MTIEITSINEQGTLITRAARRILSRRTGTPATRTRRNVLRIGLLLLFLAATGIVTLLYKSYLAYSQIVDARLSHGYLTSRAGIYAAPRTLRVGQKLSRDGLVDLLRRAGYIQSNASDVWNGSFTTHISSVDIHPRQSSPSFQVVKVTFNEHNRISELTCDGAALDSYSLEPEVLTNDVGMKTGARASLSFPEIPKPLVEAILSIEDRRFFDHNGLDIFGIGRAILRNAGEDEAAHGGSTITQQLVKNTYLTPERTFRRKYAEAMLAFTLERRLSKEDIFALYCNEVYMGQRGGIGVRGVKQAARIYFGKELKELSLAESATIAGMIKGPSRYSPDRHAEAAVTRRNLVIAAMQRNGVISRDQAIAGLNESLTLVPLNSESNAVAPYFIDYVNRVVDAKLASSEHSDERNARIYTTIDLDLQKLAEAAIKRQLEILDGTYKQSDVKPQAALVALDPRTGKVLAMVGGRGYQESQLNRATDALRQPGSVFKPIVYAAGLETGLSPLSMYTDAPQEFVYDHNAKYRPSNYGGGYSMGNVTFRNALVRSLNVVTVDVAMRTGLKRIARYAEDFGLSRPAPYPSLALGTTEATPLSLASAYTTFANGGLRIEPSVIDRVTDASGTKLLDGSIHQHTVIAPTTAYMITDMLSDVIDHGTARAARGSVEKTAIAGKTGTSRDGWFVGYTQNLVVAVWIGFDDNKQLGLTGAKAALPAWIEFVKGAVEMRPELGGESFERPVDILTVDIDPETGGLANLACPKRELIAITTTFAPNVECFLHSSATMTFASMNGTEYSSNVSPANSIQPLPRVSNTVPAHVSNSDSQRSSRSTRVITDKGGRNVLVNELRVRALQ